MLCCAQWLQQCDTRHEPGKRSASPTTEASPAREEPWSQPRCTSCVAGCIITCNSATKMTKAVRIVKSVLNIRTDSEKPRVRPVDGFRRLYCVSAGFCEAYSSKKMNPLVFFSEHVRRRLPGSWTKRFDVWSRNRSQGCYTAGRQYRLLLLK